MKVARSVVAARRTVAQWRRDGQTVGFVPTMGALHEGHLSLMRRSQKLCDRTVVSIFVNPTQFGPGEDYGKYPRAWKRDRELCKRESVDLIFAPSVAEMYPDGISTTVRVGALGDRWEGKLRLGHFDGVATVVAKLFNCVGPDVAVFGRKDIQQSVIIRRMVRDLDLPVRVVVAPTVREPGGLAMSSRNAYLDTPTRTEARSIFRSMKWAEQQVRSGVRNIGLMQREMTHLIEAGKRFKIDYIGFCDPESLEPKKRAIAPLVILIAVRCLVKGPAHNRRFIDNLVIR